MLIVTRGSSRRNVHRDTALFLGFFGEPESRFSRKFCGKKTTAQKIVLFFYNKVIHRPGPEKSYPQQNIIKLL
jgi:hypothetical protein